MHVNQGTLQIDPVRRNASEKQSRVKGKAEKKSNARGVGHGRGHFVVPVTPLSAGSNQEVELRLVTNNRSTNTRLHERHVLLKMVLKKKTFGEI